MDQGFQNHQKQEVFAEANMDVFMAILKSLDPYIRKNIDHLYQILEDTHHNQQHIDQFNTNKRNNNSTQPIHKQITPQ